MCRSTPGPGWPVETDSVSLKLFRSQEAARRASLGGIQRLVALALQKDLAWLHKDLRALAQFAPLLANFCSVDELCATAFENLQRHLLPGERFPALTRRIFAPPWKKAAVACRVWPRS